VVLSTFFNEKQQITDILTKNISAKIWKIITFQIFQNN